jgi:hypothetical protein
MVDLLAESKPPKGFMLADRPLFQRGFDSLSEFPAAVNAEFCARALESRARRDSKGSQTARRELAPAESELNRHQRRCAICHHPEREMIESYFIRWHSANQIASDFGLHNVSGVYRHAHALNLFPRRARNLRAMLERMFERAGNVSLTADSLVRAVRTYASLTENGDWVEPATTHIVAAAPPAPQAPSALSPATSAVVVDAPPPLSPALSASVSGPSTSDFGLQTQPAAPQTRDSNRECPAIRNRPKVLKNKEADHV